MYIRVTFFCFCMFVVSVASNKRRLKLIESRLSTLEMRMNVENQEMKSTVEFIESELGVLNNSISEIEERVCQSGNLNKPRGEHINETNFRDTGKRVLAAFMEQKAWIYSNLRKIENKFRQFEQNRVLFQEKVENISEQTKNLENKDETEVARNEEQFERFQGRINVLEDNIATLTHSNSELAAEIEKRDKIIEDILTDVSKLQEQQRRDTEILKCPLGWTSSNDFCYSFEDNAMSYAAAKTLCFNENAHIVDIQSKAENELVNELSAGKKTWLGMTDEDIEGEWKWNRTGDIAIYTNWRPGQPNNIGGIQHCGMMGEIGSPPGFWDDVTCDYSGTVICKRVMFSHQ